MQLTNRAIADDVLAVLSRASAEENRLYLGSQQLDRRLYVATNKVIDAMGGKWKGGKTKAHVFPEGTDVALLLDAVVTSGRMPDKNPHAFFRTTAAALAAIEPYFPSPERVKKALEPSCGDGFLLAALARLYPTAELVGIEIDAERCAAAQKAVPSANCINMKFGQFKGRFDFVLMNPPFAVKGDPLAYVTHIQWALRMLEDDGCLIAIAPAGISFRQDTRVKDLREHPYGELVDLPENAFAESGTQVATTAFIVDRG